MTLIFPKRKQEETYLNFRIKNQLEIKKSIQRHQKISIQNPEKSKCERWFSTFFGQLF